jgi:protein-S-isoprenylcysteine O-methyltransferase Ste14
MKPAQPAARPARSGRHADVAGEHAFTDIGQLILAAVFLAVWIADSFIVHFSAAGSARLPAPVRWPVGGAVALGAALLVVAAHRKIFGAAARQTEVIVDGVYAISRHPMYLGSWLFFLGLTLTTLSIAAAGVLLIMLAFYLFVSRHEEKLLVARFGSRYRDYQAATARFFPVRLRLRTPTVTAPKRGRGARNDPHVASIGSPPPAPRRSTPTVE